MKHAVSTGRVCSRGHRFTGEEPCPLCWPGYRIFKIQAKVWLWPGKEACWHFVTLPKKQSETIKERFGDFGRGWGSLPVTVTIGKTSWETSIFPDKKRGAFVLPLKADIRKKEKIGKGDSVALKLAIRA